MINKDSVSFKDIIVEIISIVKYLLSKWLIIGIVGIVAAVIGIIYAITAKPTYSATSNFVLATNSSSGGSLMGLASQLGVNFDNGGNNAFSGDNITILMQSRRMVQQALFSKPDNTDKSLLNIFIRDNEIDEKWKQNERTKNAYPFPDDPTQMNLIQDSLFRTVYKVVGTTMLDISKPDNGQNIYEVTTTSTNDTFSYYLTKYLVTATSTFYIATKTSIAKKNLNMLQNEADSIRNVLGGAITSAGSQTDLIFNLNSAYQVQRSGILQNQARAAALGQAYGQVLQNLEIAKITLQKETPLFQVIDEATMPLTIDKPGKTTSAIIGGFIGGILACCVLIAAKILRSLITT